MNKYNRNTVKIDGEEVDRSKVVFRPKETDGKFRTFDGVLYIRDKNGCIRKAPQNIKE